MSEKYSNLVMDSTQIALETLHYERLKDIQKVKKLYKQKYIKVESEIDFLKEYAKEWYDELPPTAHADLLRRIKQLGGEE